jgi:cation transport ATPase
VEPVVYTPVSAVANLRRSSVLAAVLGVVALAACSAAGHPLMGVFAIVGLAGGAVNNLLLQKSVLRFAAYQAITRKRFGQGVLIRLGAVTALAFGIGLLIRPDGLAVFAGLAVFQVLMLVGAALPVFRGLRPTAGAR